MPYRLTPEVENQVVQFIRAGGFAWVAAEAAGVPRRVFARWLARGVRSARQPYRRFYRAVVQARAQARMAAEAKAREQDPRFWLKHGPGRERPGRPGWTNPAKSAVRRRRRGGSVLASAEGRAVLAALGRALEPFPEARAAVSAALAEQKKGRGKPPA